MGLITECYINIMHFYKSMLVKMLGLALENYEWAAVGLGLILHSLPFKVQLS